MDWPVLTSVNSNKSSNIWKHSSKSIVCCRCVREWFINFVFEKFASTCICKHLVGVVGSHEIVDKVKLKGKGIVNFTQNSCIYMY